MQLVAEFDGQRIDITANEWAVWDTIHRRRLGDRLKCPECRSALVAKKMSATGTRFLAHRSDSTNCTLAKESPEHQALKTTIIGIVRGLGWDADPEVTGYVDGGRYRADVYAKHPDGSQRPWIFEVQLSGQHDDETERRTRLLASTGANVVWLTRRETTWRRRSPTWVVDITAIDAPIVTAGVWQIDAQPFPMEPTPLAFVIALALSGGLIWVSDLASEEPVEQMDARWGGWLADRELHLFTRWQQKHRAERLRREQQQAERPLKPATRPAKPKPEPPPPPLVIAKPRRTLSVLEQIERIARAAYVPQMKTRSAEMGWTCDVYAGNEKSRWGTILVIQRRLVIVQPILMDAGWWPGAVVISNPIVAAGRRAVDIDCVTHADWQAQPRFGTCDPLVVGATAHQADGHTGRSHSRATVGRSETA